MLLTHDVATITSHAYQRLRSGQPMPGVFQVTQTLSVAQAIDELLLIVECSLEGGMGRTDPLPSFALTALSLHSSSTRHLSRAASVSVARVF